MNLVWTALTTSGVTAAVFVGLGLVLREWLSARLKQSIAAEYARGIEQLRAEYAEGLERLRSELSWEEKRRIQAIGLPELFSLWLKGSYDKDENPNRDKYLLQKKYWELVPWLDADVLRAVHRAFANSGKPGVTHKEALIAVRRAFCGKDDPITAEELYHWSPDA